MMGAMESPFVFAACQPGAEPALKAEAASRVPEWRLAFSRPGFVTFKAPRPLSVDRFESPRLTFARTLGVSLDRVAGDGGVDELARRVWEVAGAAALVQAGPVKLHVWQRDTALPGHAGVEPGPTALSIQATAALRAAAPPDALESRDETPGEAPAQAPRRPAVALDVAIVDPTEWWVGAHPIRSRTDRWPGGVPRLELPPHAVSRAYLKMQEALRWSAFPTRKGDPWVEIGCAPGGASQALLDAGMLVAGVDPAAIDDALAEDPRFRHIRARAAEAPLKELAGAVWMAADVNAAPASTLAAVGPIVTRSDSLVRGVLLTMKLLDPEMAEPARVAECVEAVRAWGFADVRARQLAFNRQEFCLAALRSRGQRRMKRGRRLARPRNGAT